MEKNKKKILITGGAGYIGQNLTKFLLKKNFKIFIIDNLSTSKPLNKELKNKVSFHKIDLNDEKKVKNFFKKNFFDTIIHLAAFSGVKEFNKNILKSFNNNVVATQNLIRFGFKNQNTKFIFASSAAVYGKTSKQRVLETNKCKPVNYYGLSKYACENIINRHFKNTKVRFAILRYFNVIGSLLNHKTHKKINSLFDIVGNNIRKKQYRININGNKLDTKDGTPERDFIHVYDLCRIHEKTFTYLNKKKNTVVINCGSGKRYSVGEVVRGFEKLINKKFKITNKVTNSDETQTICANNEFLKKSLKITIYKNKISDYVKDYL